MKFEEGQVQEKLWAELPAESSFVGRHFFGTDIARTFDYRKQRHVIRQQDQAGDTADVQLGPGRETGGFGSGQPERLCGVGRPGQAQAGLAFGAGRSALFEFEPADQPQPWAQNDLVLEEGAPEAERLGFGGEAGIEGVGEIVARAAVIESPDQLVPSAGPLVLEVELGIEPDFLEKAGALVQVFGMHLHLQGLQRVQARSLLRAFLLPLHEVQPQLLGPGHQLSAHVRPDELGQARTGEVDGVAVPVRHFGAILDLPGWQALADKLQAAGTRFIIEPHVRFKGEVGEQATMFFLDPSGNALEFKSFADMGQVFAK